MLPQLKSSNDNARPNNARVNITEPSHTLEIKKLDTDARTLRGIREN
jgi:hypothetical protein